MTEHKVCKATVRIHGSVNREQIEEATIKFMKGVIKCRRQTKSK